MDAASYYSMCVRSVLIVVRAESTYLRCYKRPHAWDLFEGIVMPNSPRRILLPNGQILGQPDSLRHTWHR